MFKSSSLFSNADVFRRLNSEYTMGNVTPVGEYSRIFRRIIVISYAYVSAVSLYWWVSKTWKTSSSIVFPW